MERSHFIYSSKANYKIFVTPPGAPRTNRFSMPPQKVNYSKNYLRNITINMYLNSGKKVPFYKHESATLARQIMNFSLDSSDFHSILSEIVRVQTRHSFSYRTVTDLSNFSGGIADLNYVKIVENTCTDFNVLLKLRRSRCKLHQQL